MSLGCFECKQMGAFNTLILFKPKGRFNKEKPVSSYSNFYTCCASFNSFKAVKKSRFMIVEEKSFADSWNTGKDGDKLKDTKFKYIDEKELEAKLPNIFKRFTA